MQAQASAAAISRWLLLCCVTLLLLVMVGGATRLTGSGLSIVEWRPVTGMLPPIGESAWQAEFDKYRQSPEYRGVNRGMSLAAFKTIFWFEYWHRVLARTLGVLFAVPLAWFWWRGRLPEQLRWPLLGILALGAAQGYLGWFMVKSGLVDLPRVSPYRLAAHLSLALAIYASMFWLLLGLRWPPAAAVTGDSARWRWPLVALVALTVVFGAFVAGLKAGYVYNSFPLMDGRWIPSGLLHYQPWWRNLFESPLTAQFIHRWLGISTLLACLGNLWWVRRCGGRNAVFSTAALLAAVATLQAGLGIAALLHYVPVWLGTLHQGVAVLLLSAALAFAQQARPRGR